MNVLGKVIIGTIVIVLLMLFVCARTHGDVLVGSGYSPAGKPFTNWMLTDGGVGGTTIIRGGSGRTGITYIYGAGAGVRQRERESAFWIANPLGKGFNK